MKSSIENNASDHAACRVSHPEENDTRAGFVAGRLAILRPMDLGRSYRGGKNILNGMNLFRNKKTAGDDVNRLGDHVHSAQKQKDTRSRIGTLTLMKTKTPKKQNSATGTARQPQFTDEKLDSSSTVSEGFPGMARFWLGAGHKKTASRAASSNYPPLF